MSVAEATSRVVPPAPGAYKRIRLLEGEVAWLTPAISHSYSLDGWSWYATADVTGVGARDAGVVRLEAPCGGCDLYTTQPLLVRLGARGASFVPYASVDVNVPEGVQVNNLPAAWRQGLPVVETIYDSGDVTWKPTDVAQLSSGFLELAAYERIWGSLTLRAGSGVSAETIVRAVAVAAPFGSASGYAFPTPGDVTNQTTYDGEVMFVAGATAPGSGTSGTGGYVIHPMPPRASFVFEKRPGYNTPAATYKARIHVMGVRRG